jgi:hypothetical protein
MLSETAADVIRRRNMKKGNEMGKMRKKKEEAGKIKR